MTVRSCIRLKFRQALVKAIRAILGAGLGARKAPSPFPRALGYGSDVIGRYFMSLILFAAFASAAPPARVG